MKQRVKYFFGSLIKVLAGHVIQCPSCGSENSSVMQRKYLVTALRRCEGCGLMFRTPTTTKEENASFYAAEYEQGFTTSLPSQHELQVMVDSGFAGAEKEYRRFISLLENMGAKVGDKVFDFGCSWGYGAWQLMQHGFDVEAYEVPGPRAEYARSKLGVKVPPDLGGVTKESFDVFFSSHVLEHVPCVHEVIQYGMERLKPGGLFVAFSPNGSMAYRRQSPDGWKRSWGLVHPNLLDEQFYQRTFSDASVYLASNPYDADEVSDWAANGGRLTGRLDGDELMVIVRKPQE